MGKKVLLEYLVQLIEHWHFWVYFDINTKLLSGKNAQNVNKQIRDS